MRGSLLWWHSIRRRGAAAAGLFLIVVTSVAAATAGPVLVRAAQQSALRAQLAAAAPGRYDLTVTASLNDQPVRNALDAIGHAARATGTTLFAAPIVTERANQPVSWRLLGSAAATGVPVALDGGCAPLRVLRGQCPGRSQVLLPARPGHVPSALGGRVTFVHKGVVPFTVSGYYDETAPGARALRGSGAPALYVAVGDVGSFASAPLLTARDPLRPGALTLDRLAAASAAVNAVTQRALVEQLIINVDGTLSGLIATVHAQQRVANVLGLLVIVPIVLLSWYALALIMQLIAVVRAREWALGRLRGLPLPAWLRSLYAEPGALLAAGAVVGVGIGLVVARLTVSATMAAGTELEPVRLPVCVAVGGAIAGAAAGIVVATARGIRLPLATLLQESAEPAQVSRTGAAAQSLLVVLTVLAVLQLRTQRQLSVGAANLGLLLPGLLATILTLAVIRIGAIVIRRRAARPPRSIGTLVLGRRLARAPRLLWRYSLISVATALAVFTVQLIVLMNRNLTLRAATVVGADRVLHVRSVSTATLTAAVAAADPSGQHAMAVEELSGIYAGGTSRVLAVQSGRLAAVAAWQPRDVGFDGSLARALDPPHRAPIAILGTQLTVHIADVDLVTSPYDVDPLATPPHPVVEVVLAAGGSWHTVSLGPLTPAGGVYRAAIPCAHGCVLRQLGFRNPSATEFTGGATITAISTDRQPAARFHALLNTPTAWQSNLALAESTLPVTAKIGIGRPLHIVLQDLAGHGDPAVLPADAPSPLPALLATGTQTSPISGLFGTVNGTTLDGQSMPLRVVGRVSALPRALNDGVLVDLGAADRLADPAQSVAIEEVWVAPHTPDSVLAALRRHGLVVDSVERLADARAGLAVLAPPRTVAADAVLVVVLAALAAIALGAGVAIDGERRRQHLRVLRDAGIAPRTIRRLGLHENAWPPVLAVLLGAVAALVSLLLAGSRLPLFADSLGPPLATQPDWPSLAGSAGTLLAAVGLAAVALSSLETRSALRRSR